MNNTMPMSTQPQIIDNSFKIKIGPRNIKPEIINLDSDGAPPRPSGARFDSDGAPMLPINRNIVSTASTSIAPITSSMNSISNMSITPVNNSTNTVIPKGVSITSSSNNIVNSNPKPPQSENGIPDLSSLLEEEDWINSQVIILTIL